MKLLSRIQQALETAGVMCMRSGDALSLPEYGVLETQQTELEVKCRARGVRYARVSTTTEALLTVSSWEKDEERRRTLRPKHLTRVK